MYTGMSGENEYTNAACMLSPTDCQDCRWYAEYAFYDWPIYRIAIDWRRKTYMWKDRESNPKRVQLPTTKQNASLKCYHTKLDPESKISPYKDRPWVYNTTIAFVTPSTIIDSNPSDSANCLSVSIASYTRSTLPSQSLRLLSTTTLHTVSKASSGHWHHTWSCQDMLINYLRTHTFQMQTVHQSFDYPARYLESSGLGCAKIKVTNHSTWAWSVFFTWYSEEPLAPSSAIKMAISAFFSYHNKGH